MSVTDKENEHPESVHQSERPTEHLYMFIDILSPGRSLNLSTTLIIKLYFWDLRLDKAAAFPAHIVHPIDDGCLFG